MVKKTVSFFYPKDSSSDAWAPQLLDGLPNWCQEVILTNMKQAVSLTLGILMSLCTWADLDAAGDSFVATFTDKEGLKLMEDYALMTNRIVDMVSVHMS
jgi:hypothetical protein